MKRGALRTTVYAAPPDIYAALARLTYAIHVGEGT